VFRQLLADVVSPEVIAEFCACPSPSDLGIADMVWLDRLISKVRGEPFAGSRRIIADRTRPRFDYIIGFHACRPRSLEAIRKNGVLASSRDRLTNEAREIFGTTREVEQTIKEVWHEVQRIGWDTHDDGKTWMFLHLEEGRENCSHYCSHGSEWLQRLGSRLGREHELSRIGVPAIVECAVPLAQYPNWESASTEAVAEILRGAARLRPLRRQELCLKVHGNIEPENIVRIHDLSAVDFSTE